MNRVASLSLAVFALVPSLISRGALVAAPQQVRDAPPAPVVGSATLSGTIVSNDQTAAPLRHTVVLLTAGGISTPRSTVTGDDGAFAFDRLPAGHYTLAAQRPAFVPAVYGATKPGVGSGVPIAVADGQHVAGVTLRMTKGAVLTGVVHYENGAAADRLQVQATAVETIAGERRVTSLIGLGTTDDRGVYRIFGLAPGDYLVQVSVAPVQVILSRGDTREVTSAEVQWAESAVAPGRGTPGLAPPPLATAPATGRRVTYAPTYYPGTADVSSATTVTIGPGEEHQGVDLTLTLTPTARIEGRVFDPDGGAPQGASVQIAPSQTDAADLLGAFLPRNPATVKPDGTFSISGVTPGRYRITARASPRAAGAAPAKPDDPMAAALQALTAILPGGSSAGGKTLWAEDDVTIDGRDLDSVSLRLQPGMTVSGTVVFDRSTATPPADLTKLSVSLSTLPTGSSPIEMLTGLMGAATGQVAADGTFRITGIAPDAYVMHASTTSGLIGLAAAFSPGGAPAMPGHDPWVLKSIVANGHDLADQPFELRAAGDVSGVVVTFTDRSTELSGTVRDRAGQPISSFPIVVFSTDRTAWFPGSRRIEQAQLSSDGAYRITGLPAGEYFLCAVTALQPNELYDPLFLGQIADTAIKVVLADGEKKTQDLRVGGS